jgi:hypothetical protein
MLIEFSGSLPKKQQEASVVTIINTTQLKLPFVPPLEDYITDKRKQYMGEKPLGMK